jgi:hypothetical protein
MNPGEVARSRLANQQITAHTSESPKDVVASFGGMQAQDYRSALWAVGLRLAKASEADVEQALATAAIVRTWAMRGTLHFVAAADVRWILGLLAPRAIAGSAYRRSQLEIDDLTLARSRDLFMAALADGSVLARPEAMGLLEGAGIKTIGQRGIHILRHLSLEGLLCQLAFKARQPTFGLLDAWVPRSAAMDRGDALAELASRYFSSRGPATLKDFVWWSGLTVADAKAAIELAATRLAREQNGDTVYWMPATSSAVPLLEKPVSVLPSFDEYILAYADREMALGDIPRERVFAGGVFRPTVVVDGRVVGTWNPGNSKRVSSMDSFTSLDAVTLRAVDRALGDYDRFVRRSTVSATYQAAAARSVTP